MMGLAACGGGGGPSGPVLSRAQVVTRVNAECHQLLQASNDLASAQDPNAHGTRVEHYMKAAASQLRSRVAAIGALHTPGSISGDVSRFVSLLGQYADGLDALASRIRSGETYADLLNRSGAQVSALNNLSSRTNTIAARLGFTACGT
ncbi:MAG TPA: hypothetical protein VLV81_05455 [Acidimicrobiia bacterium]|nr:hypothetical protein [Acidimicrobiia bacterium]